MSSMKDTGRLLPLLQAGTRVNRVMRRHSGFYNIIGFMPAKVVGLFTGLHSS